MKYLFLSLICVGCAAFGSLAAEDVKPAAAVTDCAMACDDAKVAQTDCAVTNTACDDAKVAQADCAVKNADAAAACSAVKATKVADACCPEEAAKTAKVSCTIDADMKVAVVEDVTEAAK